MKITNKYDDYIYDSPATDDEYISPAPRLPKRKNNEVQQITAIEPEKNLLQENSEYISLAPSVPQRKNNEVQQKIQMEPEKKLPQKKTDILPPTKCHNCKLISSKYYFT